MQKVTVSNQDVRHDVTLLHVNSPRGLNNEFDTILTYISLKLLFIATDIID